MKEKRVRIEFIDSLKGFAIFLVVWGHCIQNLKKDINFFQNSVFEFIYSFHMPLFFMLSGFFFLSCLKLTLKDFICKKITQLILPCLVWAIIYGLITLLGDVIKNQSIEYKLILSNIIDPLRWPFWFLRELFISFMLVFLFYKIFKKDWIVVFLSILFVLILPFHNLYFQRYLLPMFLCGILLGKYYCAIKKYSIQLVGIFFIIFLICLFFWKGEYTIYIIGFPSLLSPEQWRVMPASLFRFLIGISGSIFFFFLFEKIYIKNKIFSFLEIIGIKTLSIYIVQKLILETDFFNRLDFYFVNETLFSCLIAPLMSILIIIICLYIIKWIKKNKYVSFLLIGTQLPNSSKIKYNVNS